VINERVVVGDGKTTPARTPLSETISNAMRKRGFQLVGPVVVYAWMQAVGIVDDHETH
jgi:DNA-3-methyladenine glycosylase I